ncbi:MAG: hypothetical protein NTV34_13200 [Proteobacteria bacterium]|nr:hypothetical protein [Pseudomonadota bacterium]
MNRDFSKMRAKNMGVTLLYKFCNSRIKLRLILTVAIVIWSVTPQASYAGIISLRLGPPGVGTGGTNPLGIPPGPTDIDLGYVSQSKWETSISAVPGLFLGKRIDFGGPYVGIGGGLAISSNGVGPGPYTAFGIDLGGGTLRFNMEYKQAIGMTQKGIVSPYALRIGIAWY